MTRTWMMMYLAYAHAHATRSDRQQQEHETSWYLCVRSHTIHIPL